MFDNTQSLCCKYAYSVEIAIAASSSQICVVVDFENLLQFESCSARMICKFLFPRFKRSSLSDLWTISMMFSLSFVILSLLARKSIKRLNLFRLLRWAAIFKNLVFTSLLFYISETVQVFQVFILVKQYNMRGVLSNRLRLLNRKRFLNR